MGVGFSDRRAFGPDRVFLDDFDRVLRVDFDFVFVLLFDFARAAIMISFIRRRREVGEM
jgi:hypothetical protein